MKKVFYIKKHGDKPKSVFVNKETDSEIFEHLNASFGEIVTWWEAEYTPMHEAIDIMIDRAEEKDRMYGSFEESIIRASIIATQLTGMEITPLVLTKCLIALKVGRMKFNLKRDTIVDAIAYIYGLYDLSQIFKDNSKDIPF